MKIKHSLITIVLAIMVVACGKVTETPAIEWTDSPPEAATLPSPATPAPAPTSLGGGGAGFAFIAKVNGQADIYYMTFDGSSPVNLTNDSLIEDQFEWSPAGNQLAYHVMLSDHAFGAPFQNWIINADGSGKLLLMDCPIGCSPVSWSPDGEKMVALVTVGVNPKRFEVVLMNSEGNYVETVFLSDSMYDLFRWSPDSKSLAFTTRNPDGSDTMMIYDTQTRVQYVSKSSPGQILPIAWSPDGIGLLYFDSNTTPDIYHVVNISTSVDLTLKTDVQLEGWFSNGLIYGFRNDRNDIVTLGLDDGDPSLRFAFFSAIEKASVSPDGTRVVVRPYLDPGEVSRGEYPPTELYLITNKATEHLLEPEMLPGVEDIIQIAWQPGAAAASPIAVTPAAVVTNQPDGLGSFAFIARVGGQTDIYLANADDRTVVNLTQDEAYEDFFTWSPDGSQLAYRIWWKTDDGRSHYQNWVINADGSGKRLLLECSTGCGPLRYSPDGSFVAAVSFSTIEGELDQVELLRPNGSERRTVMAGLDLDIDLRWSPDSNKIAIAVRDTDELGSIAIYHIDDDYGEFYAASNFHKDVIGWSPEGTALLYDDVTSYPCVPHILHLDTNQETILDVGCNHSFWAQDGSIFGVGGDNMRIYQLNADGSGYRDIFVTPWIFYRGFSVSADLQYLLSAPTLDPENASTGRTTEHEIYLMNRSMDYQLVVGAEQLPGLEHVDLIRWHPSNGE